MKNSMRFFTKYRKMVLFLFLLALVPGHVGARNPLSVSSNAPVHERCALNFHSSRWVRPSMWRLTKVFTDIDGVTVKYAGRVDSSSVFIREMICNSLVYDNTSITDISDGAEKALSVIVKLEKSEGFRNIDRLNHKDLIDLQKNGSFMWDDGVDRGEIHILIGALNIIVDSHHETRE